MSFITKPIEHLAQWASSSSKKRVYEFHEGSEEDRDLLGIKGSNLCVMSRLGLPVPDGFIITTETCLDYFTLNHTESDIDYFVEDKQMPDGLERSYLSALHALEKSTKRQFGSVGSKGKLPLLLAVRASAAVPMPGLMDTVLNLGMNDSVADLIAEQTGSKRFALDLHRKFLNMFGHVVLKVDQREYERRTTVAMEEESVDEVSRLSLNGLERLVKEFKTLGPVPSDPHVQLKMTIEAMFCGWHSERARKHRIRLLIPDQIGVAVIVQAMVYGNRNRRSCSGVACSRHPETGENHPFGEFVMCVEGDDLIHGAHTTHPLQELHIRDSHALENLSLHLRTLENTGREAQEVEFTVDDGDLFLLESKPLNPSPQASVRIAVDMVRSKLLSEREAILRVDPLNMTYFLSPTIDRVHVHKVIGTALKGSAGAVSGRAVFSGDEARDCAAAGVPCILILEDPSEQELEEDISFANGLLFIHGGVTSRAAEAARERSIPAVTGAHTCGMSVNASRTQLILPGGQSITKDEEITIDGSHGNIIYGAVPTIPSGVDNNFLTFMRWVEKYKRMHVYTMANNLDEATKGVELGAEGMGVYKVETLLTGSKLRTHLLGSLLCEKDSQRCHLNDIELLLQRELETVFHLFAGKVVTIRLLDLQTNDFLPSTAQEIADLAGKLGLPVDKCEKEIMGLRCANPLLGVRGCRLAILRPTLVEMQTRAIMKAAIESEQRDRENVRLKIMIPTVSTDHEIEDLAPIIRNAAEEVFAEKKASVLYILGSGLEVPRACMRANAIATEGDVAFLSFDLDHLTQLVYGLSRDDCARVLETYTQIGIMKKDPFVSLDERGVGSLLKLAKKLIRRSNRFMRIGASGIVLGDPKSVDFLEQLGFDYISCYPFLVPSAKVAAAQAHIRASMRESVWNKGVFDSPTLDP